MVLKWYKYRMEEKERYTQFSKKFLDKIINPLDNYDLAKAGIIKGRK